MQSTQSRGRQASRSPHPPPHKGPWGAGGSGRPAIVPYAVPGDLARGRLVVSVNPETGVVEGFDAKGDRFVCTAARWSEWVETGDEYPVPSEFWLRRRG